MPAIMAYWKISLLKQTWFHSLTTLRIQLIKVIEYVINVCKAFDIIQHNSLIKKLAPYSISKNILNVLSAA